MSQRLISRSPDLKRLQDEGYDLEIRSSFLLVRNVPYFSATRQLCYGTLVSQLELANDVTVQPGSHVAMFVGEHPCKEDGSILGQIQHSSSRQRLLDDLEIDHTFSAKPKDGGYRDYHHKMTTYIHIISAPARSIDPAATAQIFPVIRDSETDDVFQYLDTASDRAGIGPINDKLRLDSVAIVGLGGTGGYVLDLLAKAPVNVIHLFDGDRFIQHNAFRSPGAAAGEDLAGAPLKVDYLARVYSRMRRDIVPHPHYIDKSSVHELSSMKFVFICVDKGAPKKLIIEELESFGIPFIDVGMGLLEVDGALSGLVRVTASTPDKRDHVRAKHRIALADADGNEAYGRNVQIADLNALNAALAVIRWKKLCGFYVDLEHEHHTVYAISGNIVINEDQA
jgi:ThiF family